MYKYELYEIDTYMGYKEKLIAKSNDLEKLRQYANHEYVKLAPECGAKEVRVEHKCKDLFRYENNSGGYHGAPYYPSAVIRVAPSNFIIIE